MNLRNVLCGVFTLFLTAPTAMANTTGGDFETWLAQVKQEALSRGISERVIHNAFSDAFVDESVIELDRKQPESKMTLQQYLKNVVPQSRVEKARRLMAEHRAVLARIEGLYGVPKEVIVALWGIESNFGERQGTYDVVNSLATLAYEGRRGTYFRNELMNALLILEQEHMGKEALSGSWAGAMGQCQFMPTSFLKFAVDGDGDGRRDIWHSEADVFASAANYLKQAGWNPKAAYGSAKKPGHNFNVILKWNRSSYFAEAVGKLSRALKEK